MLCRKEVNMELYMGSRIAELRKAKGMTQEQLAAELGISAPAVSKWETDSSYPDITLLCPLARALGTDVDNLLAYEEELSQEKVAEYAQRILKIKQEQGTEKAEEELEKLLHQYPNSIPLKYQAVALLTLILEMQSPPAAPSAQDRGRKRKRELLQQIYESKNREYLSPAIASLAALELQEEHLEEAEALLQELPQPVDDATGLWVQLYLKKGQPRKAEEILQKRLFTLLCQASICLTMMIERTVPEEQKALELCGIYRKLEEIIYEGTGNSALVSAAVYGNAGREQQAADCLVSYLESYAEGAPRPNPLLFAPAISRTDEERSSTKEIREMMLRGIMADEVLAKLCERDEVQTALRQGEWI